MKIELKKFGELLLGRPSGREAALIVKSYLRPGTDETVELDFAGVMVLTPSWLDEFVSELKKHLSGKIVFLPSENPTVIESLKFCPQEHSK